MRPSARAARTRGAHGGREGGDDDVGDVAADAASGGGGGGEVGGHVDEGARLAGADLVEEDTGMALADDDVAVVLRGKGAVAELEGVELGADDGGGGEVLLAELGGVAVGDDGELAEEAVGLLSARLLVGGDGGDAEDLVESWPVMVSVTSVSKMLMLGCAPQALRSCMMKRPWWKHRPSGRRRWMSLSDSPSARSLCDPVDGLHPFHRRLQRDRGR